MAELKTTQNDSDVETYLNSVEHPTKRTDSFKLLQLMGKVTGLEPKMWGIVSLASENTITAMSPVMKVMPRW